MSRYDIEKFDPAPDPDLVCCICQCVLDKAVECPCRHVFCQGCIERWLTNRHTCPTCRKRTMKQDLQPVLPLVQNMLNRLLMICDYRDNGCLDKIMLEHYENHIKDCGYEMKTCRFIKCGKNILKMYLEQHESTDCEHRESLCGGECGLMIALSDRPTHECMDALKSHIDEKNRMIETLKSKLHELNNLSQSLNDQLEQLRQQLDENRPRSSMSLYSGSYTDVSEFMSDQESIFDDSNDNITDFSDSTSVNNDTSTVDNVEVDENVGGDNNDNGPVNDVMEQVEVTVVNSLFDLSSRLERVRDEMRTVLNTGTVADNDNLTENLGMRSARIDDIIDNMSRSINDTSVRSSRNESQRSGSREEPNSDRTVVPQANENRNTQENSPRSDDLNNNMNGAHNGSERDAHSDHSYSAGSGRRWPGNFSTYNNYRSPYHSERSPSHSEFSPSHSNVSPSHNSLSNRSYSNTPVGTPYTPLTPDSYRRWSDRSSRSASPNSDRYSDRRSNFSRSPSRSPGDSFLSNRYSRGSPSYHSSPVSELQSPSIASNRSNSGRSWSNFSATPINSDDQRSIGSLSPRSPASGNWSSDGWNSDNRDTEESRRSGDNWSYKSKSSVSQRDEDSHDEGRSVVDSPRSDNSYRHNSDRDSVVSDWCTSGNRTPESSPRHFDSDDDRGSKTPISTADNLDMSSGHLTSPNQSEPGTETPHEVTSSEEFSPRKTTPAKSEESSYWSGSSPIHPQSSPYQDRNQSVSEAAESENGSPLKASTRSVEIRKSVKSKKLSSTAETNKYQSQTATTGRNEKSDSKTSIEKIDELGISRHSVGVKTGNKEGIVYQCNIRNDKSEARSSASDSGIYSGVGGSETSQGDLPRTSERKRKANTEKEHTTSTDSLRKSKRNRSATVSRDSHQIPVIPSSTATIQTALPQSLQTPSNVNLKIDLSLYNISGQLIPQTNQVSTTNYTNKPSTNSGSSVTKQAVTSYTSTTSPVKNLTNNTKASVQRQKLTKTVHTRTSSPSKVKPEATSPQTRSQNKDNTEKRAKRQVVLNRQNSNNSNTSSTGNREFPNSWCDDSDSESDQTWVPGSDKSETDDTLTEEEEILSDSSYEVHIPKTAADLLEEYKSDDSDDSWTPN